MLMLGLLLLAAAPPPPELMLRALIAESALRQVTHPDADWAPAQRDCAGLVRHAFRTSFKALAPERMGAGLFRDASGRAAAFADAETLLAQSFVRIGRAPETQERLRSGDLLAFRQVTASGEPRYHLMLVVRPTDRAQAPLSVVYHPGIDGEAVRQGTLAELDSHAPLEWRPIPENQAFLGYFRFKEWMR